MYLATANLGVRHAFSTREGGGASNLAALASALGFRVEDVAALKQVHGERVVACETPPPPGTEGDALITDTPGLALAIRTADCVPVLLLAPDVGAIGAVHAGWRGAILAIAARAVEAMAREYGAEPARMRAAIGPSIGPCCYEVDEALFERFGQRFGRAVQVDADGKGHLDVAEASRLALLEAGILPGSIERVPACTRCDPDRFFSYRREGERAGRMVSLVVL